MKNKIYCKTYLIGQHFDRLIHRVVIPFILFWLAPNYATAPFAIYRRSITLNITKLWRRIPFRRIWMVRRSVVVVALKSWRTRILIITTGITIWMAITNNIWRWYWACYDWWCIWWLWHVVNYERWSTRAREWRRRHWATKACWSSGSVGVGVSEIRKSRNGIINLNDFNLLINIILNLTLLYPWVMQP